MAQAIPRANWLDAEEQRERAFYWQYMVNKWLVPGPSVLAQRDDSTAIETWNGPSAEALLENGWFLEPETSCEQ